MSIPAADTVFVTAEPGSPAPGFVVGGLTVLERRLREAQKRGARRALVACDGPLPTGPLTIAVERVAAGSPPPAGAEVVRADEIAGIRLDSDAACRRAEWQLLQSLPKSFQGPIDALINRHVSLRITRLLARTSLTPNHVTSFALLIGVVAAGLLLVGSRPALLAASVLMFFQSVFDSCDGELARLRYQFSKLGQWLDNIADDIVDAGLIVGLGFAAGAGQPGSIWPWLGLAGGLSRVVTQLALYVQVTRAGGDFWNFRWWFETEVTTLDQVYDPTSPITWLRSLGRRDVYVFGWAVLCAVGLPFVAAGWGVGVAAIQLGLTVIQLVMTARPRTSQT